jgi:hypothetical protein
MGWNSDAILWLLKKDKEFIGGCGPIKSDAGLFAVKHFTNPDETPLLVDGLIKCSHLGAAFIVLKRSMVERMMIEYPGMKCAAVDQKTGYSLFQFEYSENTWRGEDYTFCERWTAIGGEIWLYPDISFTHTGVKDYKGNYHQTLIASDKPEAGQIVQMPDKVEAVQEEKIGAAAGTRKNGFVEALQKIMLSETYIKRIALAVVELQGNGVSNGTGKHQELAGAANG